ncbi:DNA-directed RNA polymerase subunit beta [Salmonella enterica subsp. enterica]|nr:DNA-directed RNA polymerase subunit beta [Salmonella enterica subsp. enterica]ECW0361932.1 DNA-directed RNA polymerase subunit beta [Salmonella enterica subsp. enterica]ECW0526834.1 DNA-directed RNA polymerase subunit beta [Salmonella enterica subsp. enterica]ECW0962066.1 DNA-directed RNA polymerase subunit beta [Salmonella enterica subsp. enterica]ECW0995192.1 DNA-directed RNA polymerase subunit beta [Salmonella enterica subsp. enterica]
MKTDSSMDEINVLCVIDTELVKKKYPHPSKDQANPTGIEHDSEYMLVTGARGDVRGQGTAYLSFRANVGDKVSFTGTSIYANADDAVIVYGIKFGSGTDVFNQFTTTVLTRDLAVMPDPHTPCGIPPTNQRINFSKYSADVQKAGTENFIVYFALYTLDDSGHDQKLFGYYSWDPAITVL